MPDVDYQIYIRDEYNNVYQEILLEKGSKADARRTAIDRTFVNTLKEFYPNITEGDIWTSLAEAHKLHVAQLGDFGLNPEQQREILQRCLSAHQSWIKSSGHSFERFVSELKNEDLVRNEIKFILQKELTYMIRNSLLANTAEDVEGLQNWGKDFDLYAIQSIHGETHVFGCIQIKTSIRDRVGRDVGFSRNAMEGLFWSAAVTLDGAFLNMQEFIHMVNGGGSYPINGWHGMYALAGIEESRGRIYKVDDKLQLFADHAILAAKQFIKDRRELNHNWKAEG